MHAYRNFHLLVPPNHQFQKQKRRAGKYQEIALISQVQGNPQSKQRLTVEAEIEILDKEHPAYTKSGILYGFISAKALNPQTNEEWEINPNQIIWYESWNDYQKHSHTINVYHNPLHDIFTASELAVRSNLSLNEIYRLCENKDLPHSRFAESDYLISWQDARFFLSKPLQIQKI